MLMTDALKEIGEIGHAFADDLDDKLFGKFGFAVRENAENNTTELVATFQPLLPEERAGEENGSYGPTEEFVWRLVPVKGRAA